jgi:hypothetical protein
MPCGFLFFGKHGIVWMDRFDEPIGRIGESEIIEGVSLGQHPCRSALSSAAPSVGKIVYSKSIDLAADGKPDPV